MRPAMALTGALVLLAAPGAAARPHVAEFGRPLDGAATAHAAATARTTGVIVPGRRFDLVGVRWHGRGELVRAAVRTRRHGRWRPWVPLASAGDHGADGGGATRGSDPVWAGGADALQLRWRRAPGGMRLRFVRVTQRVRLPARGRQATADGAPAIVPRSQWDPGNDCRPRTAPSYGQVNMAFVHHTVSDNDYAPEASPAMVLAICRYHRDANGWNDIGYNFLVDKYGRLFEGRAGGIDRAVVGAQAQGWNSQSTSVSNLGTFSDVPETDAAMQAMARLLAWKLGVHGAPVNGSVTLTSAGGSQNRYPSGTRVTFQRISGHRDGGLTECPGDALYAQVPRLRRLAAGQPGTSAAPPQTQITLQALATSLQYPEPARLTGTVSGGGEVWVQIAAGSAYRTIAKAAPGSDGNWAAEVPLTRAHTFRALQVLPDGSHGAASALVPVTLRPVVTAAAPRRVLVRSTVPVAGAVAPRQARLTATLWIQGRSGRFNYVRRAAVRPTASGALRVRLPVGRAAVYRVRLAFAGTRFALAAAAPDLFVRAVRRPSSLNGGAAAPGG